MSRRLLPAAAAALAAGAGWAGASVLARRPAGRSWARTNHRGAPVTLLAGPALTLGALAGVAAAPLPGRVRAGAALVVGVAGTLGVVDDLAGSPRVAAGPVGAGPVGAGPVGGGSVGVGGVTATKGLRGHLGALAHGRLTTGGLKVLGISAAALAGAALVDGRGPLGRAGAGARSGEQVLDRLVAGGLVAGSANLVNLLDLRPGRALKVVLLLGHLVGGAGVPGSRAGAPLAAAGAGAAAVLLAPDLRERAMLGDCGANAAGALLGTALLTRTRSRSARGVVLGVVLALTALSERVSFTRVIEATPLLRELDGLGRSPSAAAAAAGPARR
ncbi:hypothetical protein [Pseudokineococcus sp. 1T1Z-3]|uniref:hypothetical protein n=1 Tax=Pseudokineococcus sp. 1T1Z-3 TaxID=3132745 RepID=UPI00309ED85C